MAPAPRTPPVVAVRKRVRGHARTISASHASGGATTLRAAAAARSLASRCLARDLPRSSDGATIGNWNQNGYRVYAPYGRNYKSNGTTTTIRDPYYYYPYAFGYGPHGRGYFYFDLHYDSYVFFPHTVIRYDNYGTYYGNYGYPTGELRLQVRPRDAQVFIDGSYAGTVDEFDGTFQSLRLEEGEYQVEIVLPGFEPLDFRRSDRPGREGHVQRRPASRAALEVGRTRRRASYLIELPASSSATSRTRQSPRQRSPRRSPRSGPVNVRLEYSM